MKLLVGLGNPGEKYQNNRHNVGFMFADFMKDSEVVKREKWIILKPQSYMNRSGEEVSRAAHFYKIDPENIFVAHDDLDIPLGKFKIQKGTGPKLHNGISSIEKLLGEKDFWRVRIGVENRGENRVSGESYVLQNFTPEERQIMTRTCTEILMRLPLR